MRLLRSEITIGKYSFDFVTDVEITSSWDLLADTATITIPKKLRYRDKDGKSPKYIVRGTEAVFKRGDEVKINCGYYPTPEFGELSVYYTAFEGYVMDVSPKRPITITCEDFAYNLKRMRIESYSSGGTPQDLRYTLLALAALVDKTTTGPKFNDVVHDIQAESIDLGETIIENTTYAGFLESLKRTHGLKSYLRKVDNNDKPTLFVGFARVTQNNTQNVFDIPKRKSEFIFGRDIIGDSNLTYQNAADIDISLTATSIDSRNKRLSVTAGASWGSARTLYYYHDLNTSPTTDEPIPSVVKELQKTAEAAVAEFKYDGYNGSFTTFGVPRVEHGDYAIITNGDIADTHGEYLLEKVVTRFGQGGFRQEVFLSARIGK